MPRVPEDIAIVERAYDLTGSLDAWLDGVHRAMAPRLDEGLGVSMSTWSVQGDAFSELGRVRGNLDPALVAAQEEMIHGVPPEVIAAHYGPGATDFIASPRAFDAAIFDSLAASAAKRGVMLGDALGVVSMGNPGQNGLVLLTMSKKRIPISASRRRLLLKLSTHLGAGLRLRLTLSKRHQLPEAVLTPSGAIVSASGAATSHLAREALRRGVRDIERSRGKLRRSSPEEALSQWRGLVAGRWSVVEWIDTDARRYLVAHVNHVSARDPRALSPRELDVAEFLVQGRSTAEIAYALGLSAGTVSRVARGVLRKLGAARRMDLSALFGDVAPWRAELEDSNVVLLSAGANAELWSRLTTAEADVVRALLKGERTKTIARRRGVSERTVSTQLATVYARFGVRGRAELATLLGSHGV